MSHVLEEVTFETSITSLTNTLKDRLDTKIITLGRRVGWACADHICCSGCPSMFDEGYEMIESRRL